MEGVQLSWIQYFIIIKKSGHDICIYILFLPTVSLKQAVLYGVAQVSFNNIPQIAAWYIRWSVAAACNTYNCDDNIISRVNIMLCDEMSTVVVFKTLDYLIVYLVEAPTRVHITQARILQIREHCPVTLFCTKLELIIYWICNRIL